MVADSPVVPTKTRPDVPDSTCQSIRSKRLCQAMLPSDSMGVTKATIDPLSLYIYINVNQWFKKYYQDFIISGLYRRIYASTENKFKSSHF